MNQPAETKTEEQVTEANAPEESSTPAESSEWDGFVDEFDSDDLVAEEPEAPADEAAEKPEPSSEDDGAEVEAQVPEQKDESEKEPQTPEVVEEAPAEAKAPETEEPEEEEPQAKEDESPALTQDQRAELRAAALKQIEEGYKFSDEEATEFENNPTAVLPKLAANLQLTVYEQVVNSVMSQLPQYVSQLVESQRNVRQKEEEFFSEYADLAPYKEQVTQVASMWSQMNQGKKISAKQRKAEIAKFARAAIGLPTEAQVPQGTAASASAPAPTPTPPPPMAPPVQPNSGQRNQGMSVWEQMAVELENDPDI